MSPPVIEFDAEGNVVRSWGNPSLVPAGQPNAGTERGAWPSGIHGCYVDYQDNIWIAGNSRDGVVQKWSHDGSTMLLQIGTKFVFDQPFLYDNAIMQLRFNAEDTGSSRTLLHRPADIAVDKESSNEK